jgi:tRNA (guanine-N7-)-methyltransferase
MRIDRPLRSFGRRRGRKLSQRRSAQLASALPRLSLDLNAACPASLVLLFPEPVHEVWLEIGFGGGEHFIWQAEHNEGVGIIGAEPYFNGVAAALSSVEVKRLEGRIRIHPGDVHELFDWLPAASLTRTYMLFPDPWPKLRHRTRRLFTPALLDRMAPLLRERAEFRFATDIADYAEAAIAHAQAHRDFDLALTFTSAERAAASDWPKTRYEAKAAREGRSSTFAIMKRK